MGCHVIVWMPTRNFGRPSRNNVSVHEMLWTAIRKLWMRTLLCGHPDYASGVPRLCVGVRGMCVDCHAFMWASSILLVGSHETSVAGHGKNVEAHCELWACIMRAWTRMGAHAQGESEPPQLRWGAGAVQVAMRWVYSFAITAPMSDLACLGSALPTLLAKSPLGKSELNTCSASEPRSRSARAVPLACL